MMRSQVIRYFTDSAAGLLAAFAMALFLGNLASLRLVQPHDPLFALSMDVVFWIVGGGAVAVGFACIYVRQPRLKLSLILWFATNLIVYRLGLHWEGVHDLRGYVSPLTVAFKLSSGLTNGLLNLLFLYLFTASAALLIWDFLARPETVCAKAICAHCGGHIAFPAGNLGQTVSCPHCATAITLRRTDDKLKMSCFFCRGHIEFPAYAIGTKMQCPHCKMDITLLEPK